MAYRVLNAAWCLLFVYAVSVQFNDPDPVRWILAYGAGAVLSGWAAALGWAPVRITAGWGAASAAFAVLDLAFGTGQTEPMGFVGGPHPGGSPYWGAFRDEVAREVGGLSLMAGWMVVLAGWTRIRLRSGAADSEH